MSEVDLGRQALARLQSTIILARTLGYNGANLEVLYEQDVEKLVSELWQLDRYLTGKTDNRLTEDDERRFFELYTEGRIYHVYLSDGGYSRLTINLEEGHPVVMDLGLSLDRAKARWAALFPPS